MLYKLHITISLNSALPNMLIVFKYETVAEPDYKQACMFSLQN